MFNNFMNRFQRDLSLGEKLENVLPSPAFEYPLSLEEWLREFKIGTKINNDSKTETLLKELFEETKKKEKELIIRNSQRYCRLNHTTQQL